MSLYFVIRLSSSSLHHKDPTRSRSQFVVFIADTLRWSAVVRTIKNQYMFAFLVMGAILPYLPIYLRELGLSNAQVGDVLSMSGYAFVLAPVVLTLLADAHMTSRVLLGICFALSLVTLLGLIAVESFLAVLLVFAAHCVAFVPIQSLQDGLNFSTAESRVARGLPRVGYHTVRVWGTVGFILPSTVLFVAMYWMAASTEIAIYVGAFGCCLGLINVVALPRNELNDSRKPGGAGGSGNRRLPTVNAIKALTAPRPLAFCVGMFLLCVSMFAYYGFYPLLLVEHIGIGEAWVGPISTVGVLIELPFMLGFAFLVSRIGLRWLMAIGAVLVALRLALLAAFPTATIALASQLLHGITVLVLHVAPPVYLNSRAKASYRSSVHGLFAMIGYGLGRTAGNAIGGRLADHSLLWVFAMGAGLSLVAAPLLFWSLHPEADGGNEARGNDGD